MPQKRTFQFRAPASGQHLRRATNKYSNRGRNIYFISIYLPSVHGLHRSSAVYIIINTSNRVWTGDRNTISIFNRKAGERKFFTFRRFYRWSTHGSELITSIFYRWVYPKLYHHHHRHEARLFFLGRCIQNEEKQR